MTPSLTNAGKPEDVSHEAWAIPGWATEPNWKTGKTVLDRFMDICMPEPNSGCWIWLGNVARAAKPYGRMDVEGRSELAHRLSFKMFKGDISGDLFVCHKCDNPSCVNPDHLFVGSAKDNSEDRDTKGRLAYGDRCGKSRLSVDLALEIKDAHGTCRAIASKFGVDNTLVSKIKRGALWSKAIAEHSRKHPSGAEVNTAHNKIFREE